MRIKKSDLETMLEVVSCLQDTYEREANPEFYDRVNDLEDTLIEILNIKLITRKFQKEEKSC